MALRGYPEFNYDPVFHGFGFDRVFESFPVSRDWPWLVLRVTYRG